MSLNSSSNALLKNGKLSLPVVNVSHMFPNEILHTI